MEAQEYELITIKDIFEKIPLDRLETCLDELKAMLLQSRRLFDFTGSLPDGVTMERIIWIDDGKGELTTQVNVGDQWICSVRGTMEGDQ